MKKKTNLKKPNNAGYDDEGDIVCSSVSSMIDGKPKEIMIGGWRKSWRVGRNGRRGWGEERVRVRGGGSNVKVGNSWVLGNYHHRNYCFNLGPSGLIRTRQTGKKYLDFNKWSTHHI